MMVLCGVSVDNGGRDGQRIKELKCLSEAERSSHVAGAPPPPPPPLPPPPPPRWMVNNSSRSCPVLLSSADMSSSAVSCLLTAILLSAAEDPQEMKLKPEQDAALQCQSHTDDIITLLDWNRPDLKSGGYVFFYRDERSYEEYQHPRYRGRVELRDPEMKNGDVTVLLRNVSDLDTGTYECRVKTSKTPPNETTPSEIKCLIHLTVTDSGHPSGNEDGYRELVVGLSVFGVHLGVFFLVVVGFMIFRKGKGFKKNNLYDPPVNEGDPET